MQPSNTFYLICTLCIHFTVIATDEFPNPTPKGNSWAPCSFAVKQLNSVGNGSTYGSCLNCDPTSFVCPPKCQSLINALYEQCDEVYAPQDFFFDSQNTLDGYFNDHKDELRIQVQRCGCSDSKLLKTLRIAYLMPILLAYFFLMYIEAL